MPSVHKLPVDSSFQALNDGITHQERLDCCIVAIWDGAKCDSEVAPAVIIYVALNGDYELLFVFVLNISQWLRHLSNLVEIDGNIYCLVFAAELRYT